MQPSSYIDALNYLAFFDDPKNKNVEEFQNKYQSPIRYYFNIEIIILCSFFSILALYSMAFAYKRLVRKTISINAKLSFVKRHIVYVVIMLLLWAFILIMNYE